MTQALRARDHNTATEEKSKIEDRQREEASQRAAKGVEWQPRLFRRVHGGPGGSEEGEEDLNWIISAKVYVCYGQDLEVSHSAFLVLSGTEWYLVMAKNLKTRSSRF